MNISVVLHGVPYGQDVSDSSFETAVQPYYRPSIAPDEEFECVVRKVKDDSRVLYTLTLNNNVVDAENRSGSYFGLTVAMTDYYFTKVRYLYELMKIAVDRFAIGKVISMDKGTFKFVVKDLRNQQQIAGSVQDFILGGLKSVMGPDNTLPINALNSKPSQTCNVNWVDATDSELAKCMKSIGRFCVSSQFDSVSIKNARQQLAVEKEAIQKNLQEQIRQMQESVDKERKGMQQAIVENEKKCNDLQQRCEREKEEIKQQKEKDVASLRKDMQQAIAENEKKCNDLQQRCEREKEEIKQQKEKDVASLQKEIERLNTEKASSNKVIEQLKKENENLMKKGDVKVIAHIVDQLQKVVEDLKGQRDYVAQRQSNDSSKSSKMERALDESSSTTVNTIKRGFFKRLFSIFRRNK